MSLLMEHVNWLTAVETGTGLLRISFIVVTALRLTKLMYWDHSKMIHDKWLTNRWLQFTWNFLDVQDDTEVDDDFKM